jgi:branched-chain amino acid transport system permease protein
MQLLPQLLLDSVITGSQYGLMAVSFAIVYRTTKFFNFSHAAVYAWAAYVSYFFIVADRVPIPLSVALGLAAGGALGGLLSAGLYIPLQKRGAAPTTLLLASMGVLVVLANVLSLMFGDALHAMPNGFSEVPLRILGAALAPVRLAMFSVSAACLVLVYVLLRNTNIGKSIRAIANSRELAIAFGISYRRNVIVVSIAGSALAGIAAILAAFDTGLRPVMGFNALLIAVVVMIIGGVERYSGCILGGFLVALIQELVAVLLSSKWQDGIVFLLLLLLLFARPQGLLGDRSPRAQENW